MIDIFNSDTGKAWMARDWLGLGSGLERLRHGMAGLQGLAMPEAGRRGCDGARHQRIALWCSRSAFVLQHGINNGHDRQSCARETLPFPCREDKTDRKVPAENLLRRVACLELAGSERRVSTAPMCVFLRSE